MVLDDRTISREYDRIIRQISGRDRPHEQVFGPELLVKNRIVGQRIVPANGENPDRLQVYDFQDGGALIFGVQGFGEDYAVHALWIRSATEPAIYSPGERFYMPPFSGD